jgi:hypothetical protein
MRLRGLTQKTFGGIYFAQKTREYPKSAKWPLLIRAQEQLVTYNK